MGETVKDLELQLAVRDQAIENARVTIDGLRARLSEERCAAADMENRIAFLESELINVGREVLKDGG